MAKNEVANTETTAVAVQTPAPALVAVESTDMMIPFLKVVQSLSEEVMKGKDKYNADVKPGDIYDSVTRTIIQDAPVIICGLKKYYAEWTPEVRGSLVAKHRTTDPAVTNAVKVKKISDKGKEYYTLQTKSGNDLIETYGIVMLVKSDDGTLLPAVLTLAKTSFMVGKQLATTLMIKQRAGVPIFRLSTTSSSNTKGSWYKPTFTYEAEETDPSVIEMAQGLAAATDGILFNTLVGEDGTLSADDLDDVII